MLVLISLGNISNYFWGFIAVIIYGLIALAWDYVGDMQLNLFFFLPFQFIGYSLWKFNLYSNKNIICKRFNIKTALVTIYFAIILTVFFYFEIPEFSRVLLGTYDYDGTDWNKLLTHIFDALTNGFSIVAQLLMLLSFREQWIFWIIANLLKIIMYAGIAHNSVDINVLLMWLVSFFNSCFGFYQWYFVRSHEELEVKNKQLLKFEKPVFFNS